MTHSNRSRTWLAPLLALAILAPATASASDHLMKINEVMLSHGSAGAQFIELFDPTAESFPNAPYNLVIYDAAGTEVGSVAIAAPAGGAPFLVSTAAADTALSSTGAVVLSVVLPTDGQACFTNNSGAIHCVAWGCVTSMVAGAEAIPAAADMMSAQRQGPDSWQVAAPTADAANIAGTTQAACTAGDACEATDTNAIDTVGCNGAVPGPQADNAHGGNCTPSDASPQGSCTDPTHFCDGEAGGVGVCIAACTPSTLTYVSTGGCPTGSRCFDFGGEAYCYTDCNSGTDCASGACDGEGSCVGTAAPTPDAGPPPPRPDSGPAPTADAGTGGTDAGTGGGGGGGCSVQPTTGGLAGAPLALFALGLLFWRRRA